MLLMTAVVATAGLLADSPAVVVGLMVIAPLLGPALTANVGIVTGDDALRCGGFRYQALGVGVVVKGFDPGPDPGLSNRIHEAISKETEASFVVEVQYVVAEERDEEGSERIVRTEWVEE